MLFEELVEQHRVDCVIADAERFSFFVAHHQIGIHYLDIFGDKSEAQGTARLDLGFVAETHRLKRVNDVAGLLHWFDLILETA